MQNSKEDASTRDCISSGETSHLLSESSALQPDQSLGRCLAHKDRFAIKKRFGFSEILLQKITWKNIPFNITKLREGFVMSID